MLTAAAFAVTRFVHAGWVIFAWVATFVGLAFVGLVVARNGFPHAIATRVRASREGLRVDDADPIPLDEVVLAKLSPRGRDAVVDLAMTRRRKLSLRLRARDAAALMSIVGARRACFTLVPLLWKRWLLAYCGALAWSISRLSTDLELLAVAVSAVFISVPLAWGLGWVRGRLIVGADGLTTRWLRRERFIAFRDVDRVDRSGRISRAAHDTVVTLRSGRKLRLRTTESPNSYDELGAESAAMLERVTSALAAWQSAGLGVDAAALRRDARSPRDWLRGIDEALHGGYRVAVVPVDALSRLVADAAANREARVGAAVALVRIGSDESRVRVRVAAEGCAETELRAVLQAIAEADDDDSVAAALATLRA